MGFRNKEKKKLIIPCCPTDEDNGDFLLPIGTLEEKYIFDYSGISFDNIQELNCFVYWLLLRDAYVYKLQQSPQGIEYLKKCVESNETKPDRKALKNKFGAFA